MRTIMPQRLRSKGQALVEFALTATLIFLLLAAVVDLGLIFFTLQGLHNAAQEGATYGSRWLATNPATGQPELAFETIRYHARTEAGERGIGFANLLDLNTNSVNDNNEIDVIERYIEVNALLDVDGSGNPLDDGAGP